MVDEGVGRHAGSLDCLRLEAENINNKLHIEEKLGSEQKCPAYWAKIIELIDVTDINRVRFKKIQRVLHFRLKWYNALK